MTSVRLTALRLTVLSIATTVLVAWSAASALGRAQHETYEESYRGSFHLSAQDNPCGPWPVTIYEDREGSAQILTPPGGRVRGEYHVNGAVNGDLRLVPDDPERPTFTGSYREKFNGVITGADADGNDVERVSQYRLRAPLLGSDGSRLVLTMSGKVTMNANGRLAVQHDVVACG